MIIFKSLIDDIEHIALIKGNNFDKITMVRVHSFNPLVDVFDETENDNINNPIKKAMIKISKNKNGILIIINDSIGFSY